MSCKAGLVVIDLGGTSSAGDDSVIQVDSPVITVEGSDDPQNQQQTQPAPAQQQVFLAVDHAEERLSDIFTDQRFVTFYSNQAIEDGYQVHVMDNHLTYLLMPFVADVFWSIFYVANGIVDAPWDITRKIFVIITCPIAALLLAKGPLQLKSQKHRAMLHEVHTTIMINGRLFPYANYLYAVNHCEGLGGKTACLYWVVPYLASLMSVAPVIVARLSVTLVFNALPLWAVMTIVWWAQRDPGIPVNIYIGQYIVFCVVCGVTLGALHMRDRLLRKTYRENLKLALKKLEAAAAVKRADGVMQFLLPPSVLKSIIEGASVFHVEEATVIQADICNFTEWCSTRSSTEVVELLSVVTAAFDRLAVSNAVTRIKLLGDGYVAVCGLPEVEPNHAENGLKFAINMQVELTRATESYAERWGALLLRAGVHSGQVSAGVLSTQRWAYEMYGDTPAIANVLEPQASTGGVLVSAATIALLPSEMKRQVEDLPLGPEVTVAASLMETHKIDDVQAFIDEVPHRRLSIVATLQLGARARALLVGNAPGFGGGDANSNKPGDPNSTLPVSDSGDKHNNSGGENESGGLHTAPVLLQQNEEEDVASHADSLPDPAPAVYERFTRLAAWAVVAFAFATFLAWAIENNSGEAGSGALACLALFVLGLINVLVPMSVMRITTVILAALAAGIVAPIAETSQRTTPAWSILFMLLGTIAYLDYSPTWIFYIIMCCASLANAALNTVLRGEIPVAVILTIIVLCVCLSFLRLLFRNDMEELTVANAQKNLEMAKKRQEKEVLEKVLRLKIPSHVVDRLFMEDGSDVLQTSYVIKSCHVAFCRFDLGRQDTTGSAPPLQDLQLLTTLVDEVLPVDGTGILQFIEKIKTIGDVVMLGGSLLPSMATKVTDEEVLLEVMQLAQDLKVRISETNGLTEAKCFIGLDKGEVTTATVGNVNLEYDVFGTTVNTAARVMATLLSSASKVAVEAWEGGEDSTVPTRDVSDLMVTVRCTENVIPALRRLQAGLGTSSPHSPLINHGLARSIDAVNQTYFIAKGLGRVKAFILTAGPDLPKESAAASNVTLLNAEDGERRGMGEGKVQQQQLQQQEISETKADAFALSDPQEEEG